MRLRRLRDDRALHRGVVCDEREVLRELGEPLEDLGPSGRSDNVGGVDAVDADVYGGERVVARRRGDEEGRRLGDLAAGEAGDTDLADGASVGVGGLEVEGDEVEADAGVLPGRARCALARSPMRGSFYLASSTDQVIVIAPLILRRVRSFLAFV